MADEPLQVLAVVGSLHQASITRTVVLHIAERLRAVTHRLHARKRRAAAGEGFQ